jgi:flagellar protein FliS
MRAKNLYAKQSVQTAPKEQLMLMLFNTAIKNLKIAERGEWSTDREKLSAVAERAMDIIIELRQTLNHQMAPELCKQLEELYTYVISRIAVGLTSDSNKHFTDALVALSPIAEAFNLAIKKTKEGGQP